MKARLLWGTGRLQDSYALLKAIERSAIEANIGDDAISSLLADLARMELNQGRPEIARAYYERAQSCARENCTADIAYAFNRAVSTPSEQVQSLSMDRRIAAAEKFIDVNAGANFELKILAGTVMVSLA